MASEIGGRQAVVDYIEMLKTPGTEFRRGGGTVTVWGQWSLWDAAK